MTAESDRKTGKAEGLPAPGTRLKNAREAAGLDIGDIARNLRLSQNVIKALETDDFEKLPGATYVHGYLRHYAAAVKLPVDELISAYNLHSAAGKEQPAFTAEAAKKEQVRSSDFPVKATTWFVALVLVMLIFAWWQSPNLQTAEDPLAFAAKTESAPLIKQTSIALAVEVPADAMPEVAEPIPEPEPVEVSAPAQETSMDQLKLTVTEDSWIEVTDGAQSRLYYGMGRSGQTFDLSGSEPFSILFGHAAGVSIEHNGKPFDFTNLIRDGVAKFKLGQTR